MDLKLKRLFAGVVFIPLAALLAIEGEAASLQATSPSEHRRSGPVFGNEPGSVEVQLLPLLSLEGNAIAFQVTREGAKAGREPRGLACSRGTNPEKVRGRWRENAPLGSGVEERHNLLVQVPYQAGSSKKVLSRFGSAQISQAPTILLSETQYFTLG